MESKTLKNDQALTVFPLEIRDIIEELFCEQRFGLSSKPLQISAQTRITLEDNRVNYADRFILDIPYGGSNLLWEIIFDVEDFDFPPDFVFINDKFLDNPDIDLINNNIHSLVNWNVKDKHSLVCAVKEFLTLYRNYQMSRLSTERKFAHHYSEYQALLESSPYTEKDIEVYIDDNESVHFLIVIQVNGDKIPTFMQPLLCSNQEDQYLNPGEDSALLKVSFITNRVVSNLSLSPRLEQHLGNSTSLHIPSYNKEKGLVEYVANIESLINERVKEIEKTYKVKNDFISHLLTEQGPSIIEYDNVLFNTTTLLLEVNAFYCLVKIEISKRFPSEKPKIKLRSVYHDDKGKVIEVLLEDCPYSPRWSGTEMVSRLMNYLHIEIPKFKTFCTRS